MGASAEGKISCQPYASLITYLMIAFVTIPVVSVLIVGFIKEAKINPQGPKFRLESATVPQLNVSGSQLTATWDLTIVAVNPNHKLSMSFDSLQATVFYITEDDKVMLATKPVTPPSVLNKKTEIANNFKIETVSAYIGNGVANEISEGRSNGSVRFELSMLGYFRLSSYWTDPNDFRVYCNPVEFRFSPGNWTGTLTATGPSTACEDDPINLKLCVM